jgi:putative glutamine amidotransferase
MHRPVILVAGARRVDDYLESVRRAGADPLFLDTSVPGAATLSSNVAGLLITGGPDVDPRLYGATPDAHYEPAQDGRDAREIELSIRAIERDVPLLGICRGIQVLNVAAGGSLVQHIPTDVPRALAHQVRTTPATVAHDVHLLAGSTLAGLLGAPDRPRVAVNSRHHQAVARVAAGFTITASSDDGVVEAIERAASRYCLGVQWHPENFWRSGAFDALFRSFVDACRR